MKKGVKQTKSYRSAVAKINAWVKENSVLTEDFTRWYVGVTNNPTIRGATHQAKNMETPSYWLSVDARKADIALAVEVFFHNKGMLEGAGTGGVRENSRWVYVYKKNPTVIDYVLS